MWLHEAGPLGPIIRWRRHWEKIWSLDFGAPTFDINHGVSTFELVLKVSYILWCLSCLLYKSGNADGLFPAAFVLSVSVTDLPPPEHACGWKSVLHGTEYKTYLRKFILLFDRKCRILCHAR
jgi:hypothetical protein